MVITGVKFGRTPTRSVGPVELAALPGLRVPGCSYRRDQAITYRGQNSIFLGLVVAPNGLRWAKLEGAYTLVRLDRLSA